MRIRISAYFFESTNNNLLFHFEKSSKAISEMKFPGIVFLKINAHNVISGKMKNLNLASFSTRKRALQIKKYSK